MNSWIGEFVVSFFWCHEQVKCYANQNGYFPLSYCLHNCLFLANSYIYALCSLHNSKDCLTFSFKKAISLDSGDGWSLVYLESFDAKQTSKYYFALYFYSCLFGKGKKDHHCPQFFQSNLFFLFFKSQIISRSNVFHNPFYLPKVNIQVQNGHGVLCRLVPCIQDIWLACWVFS